MLLHVLIFKIRMDFRIGYVAQTLSYPRLPCRLIIPLKSCIGLDVLAGCPAISFDGLLASVGDCCIPQRRLSFFFFLTFFFYLVHSNNLIAHLT